MTDHWELASPHTNCWCVSDIVSCYRPGCPRLEKERERREARDRMRKALEELAGTRED